MCFLVIVMQNDMVTGNEKKRTYLKGLGRIAILLFKHSCNFMKTAIYQQVFKYFKYFKYQVSKSIVQISARKFHAIAMFGAVAKGPKLD